MSEADRNCLVGVYRAEEGRTDHCIQTLEKDIAENCNRQNPEPLDAEASDITTGPLLPLPIIYHTPNTAFRHLPPVEGSMS